MTSSRLRKIWLITHRWLGLTVGLLFVLIGLSGSLLVFQHVLDEWLNPELLVIHSSGSRLPLQKIVDAAQQACPDQSARLQFVDMPRSANGVWAFWFQSKSKESPKVTQVCVDPYTAKVTGHRPRRENLMGWIYELHTELLAGKTGETIVGFVGIILLVSVCSGVILWWPLLQHSWRAALLVRSGRRFNYDLHKTTGIANSVFLVVIGFTGVYLIFPTWVKPAVTAFLPETVLPTTPNSKPARNQPRLDADQALAIAQKLFPDAECKRLHFPLGANGVYMARVRQQGDVRRSSGNSRIWIDQYSGEILAVRDWYQRTTADTIFAWQFPLHNGEAFGLIGRWVVVATGLTLCVLYVTGVIMWWRKRQARTRQRQNVLVLGQTEKTSAPVAVHSNG